MVMIVADGLCKRYEELDAVREVSFEVEVGEIFGLIGPNGAGKTTTLKMLAGLLEPTAGSGTVAGYDIRNRETRRHLGFLPEDSPVYEEMSAKSYLKFFADLYDVDPDVASDRITRSLDRLDLAVRDKALGNTSKGMKRKVAIARALVNDPAVLILDEPASGLDPVTTNGIIEFLRELKGDEKSIVFSAHNLYHVEALCDRVAIMVAGEVVSEGSVEEIRAAHGGVEYQVDTTVAVEGAVEVDGHYRCILDDVSDLERVRSLIESADGELIDVRTHEPSLEEIFLSVTEEAS